MSFRAKYRIVVIVAAWIAMSLSSCNTFKYVPDNQYLLSKSKISIDNKSINKLELKAYLKQRPNTKILGFWRFHLGLYNLSGKKNEEGLLKRIGEAPVIYNSFLTQKSKEEFERFMHNKGYYQAKITDTIIYKKEKKAEVYYSIIANSPHLIRSYKTEILDDSIKAYARGDSAGTLIKLNGTFDTDVLASESKRILNHYQNSGFYRINKNEIYFEADTLKVPKRVDLKLVVDKVNTSDDPAIVKKSVHQRYTFRNFYFLTDYESQKTAFARGRRSYCGEE